MKENSPLYHHIDTAQKFAPAPVQRVLPLEKDDAQRQLELGLGCMQQGRTHLHKTELPASRAAMPVPN